MIARKRVQDPDELFYDTFLPYLINSAAVVDVLYPPKEKTDALLSAPESDFHSVPRSFGPWRSLTLLWKHLLRSRAGLGRQQVKCLKWELRSTLMQMCVHDLKASKARRARCCHSDRRNAYKQSVYICKLWRAYVHDQIDDKMNSIETRRGLFMFQQR